MKIIYMLLLIMKYIDSINHIIRTMDAIQSLKSAWVFDKKGELR